MEAVDYTMLMTVPYDYSTQIETVASRASPVSRHDILMMVMSVKLLLIVPCRSVASIDRIASAIDVLVEA